jgi:hypothetical protein
MRMQRVLFVGTLALLVAIGACNGPNEPSSTGRVALSFGTGAGTSAKGAPLATAAGADSIILGPDTLIVTSAQLVLKHIEFKTLGDSIPCARQDSMMHREDDCNELEVGPVLADLPLGGGVARLFTVPLLAGTYREVEFLIHKPGHGGDDGAFLADHPDLLNVSIRLTGMFNGTPFTFTSRVTATQEEEFTTPVVVADGSSIDVSILVDLSGWFRNGAHTGLVDPASALPDGPNEMLVNHNIRRSFRAFRDQDHDGHQDH